MDDENEVRALAERMKDWHTHYGDHSGDWMNTAREALRWRDETRPLQAPPAAAVSADVAHHASIAVSYLDHGGGMPAGLSLALQRLRAALQASPAQVAEGYAPAPVEPTQRMMEVGAKEYGSFEYMPRAKQVQGWGARANAIYRAMLAAAARKGGES